MDRYRRRHDSICPTSCLTLKALEVDGPLLSYKPVGEPGLSSQSDAVPFGVAGRCRRLPLPLPLSTPSLPGSLSLKLTCLDCSCLLILNSLKTATPRQIRPTPLSRIQISSRPGTAASNKPLNVRKQQRGMEAKPTECKPVSALGAFITVNPDPACSREFALRVIAVMSTRVFSNLIIKCHQQEQTAGKNK